MGRFVCCLIAILAVTSVAAIQVVNATQEKFRLPDLFSFEHFKSLFERTYKSHLEELARHKIYLGRAFKAFVSWVSYRHYRSPTYLSISARSDETPAERSHRWLGAASLLEAGFFKIDKLETPVGDMEAIRGALGEMYARTNPGEREILEAAEEAHLRIKRDANERVRQISMDKLIGQPYVSKERFEKVASNNAHYERLELASSAPVVDIQKSGDDDGKPPGGGFWERLAAGFNHLEAVKYVRQVIEQAVEGFRTPPTGATEIQADAVYSDLRSTGCLLMPRDQGLCSACYAFATLALYEYLYCLAHGQRVALSEQYMVDCGERTGLYGCRGGSLAASARFVQQYGFELRHHYPYRGRQESCPYDETEAFQMGYLRTRSEAGYSDILPKHYAHYLEQRARPILLALMLNEPFDDYGGGVDELRLCSTTMLHAMLLVGHGRSEGQEYYLLRNSYSVSWGEEGYYRLSRRALERCSLFAGGLVATGAFNSSHKAENQSRDPRGVQARYREHLARGSLEEAEDSWRQPVRIQVVDLKQL